jgi:isocitrate dehydrogenase
VAAGYPDIAAEHMIIDIGTARMAMRPERFDVVLTPNLYGDILSDVAAEVAGSIGLAPSANVGRECAMFEAVHGSAPDIAGLDVANPSGLLLSAVMMLVHLGRTAPATTIHNAWLRTIEDGIHTADIHVEGRGRRRVGTRAFAEAVVARLGQRPERLAAVDYPERDPLASAAAAPAAAPRRPARKSLVGIDVFVNWDEAGRDPGVLGARLEAVAGPDFRLALVTNRGVKVYPGGYSQTLRTDHWRCRFPETAAGRASPRSIAALLLRLADAGLDVVKTENLYEFDGVRGYSQAQGE